MINIDACNQQIQPFTVGILIFPTSFSGSLAFVELTNVCLSKIKEKSDATVLVNFDQYFNIINLSENNHDDLFTKCI